MTDDYQIIREAISNSHYTGISNTQGAKEREKALNALTRLNYRVVPELPDGYRLDGLSEFHDGWLATLRHKNGGKIVWSNEYPDGRFPTARQAIEAAIKKLA